MTKKLKETESSPKIGRPTLYTDELAMDICAQVADGMALYRVCQQEGMPTHATVYRWLEARESFRDSYARAKARLADLRAEEVIAIADEEPDPNKARVRIDARKWAAAKLAPLKYGERIATEISGPDGGPIQTENVTLQEVARRMAFILAKAVHEKRAIDEAAAAGLLPK